MAYIKRKQKPKKERDAIESERRKCFQRDDWRCVDCGKLVMWGGEWWERGHAAHVISAARGGKFVAENLKTKCADCHIGKEHAYGPTGKKPCPKKPSMETSVQVSSPASEKRTDTTT